MLKGNIEMLGKVVHTTKGGKCTVVCLGLDVAVALNLLLSSVRQLLLIQAEDVMYKLVLLRCLDHPTPEKHTQKVQ